MPVPIREHTCLGVTAAPVAPCIASSRMMHSVLLRLPQPCWLNVSTTVSPRRCRIALLPSARSAAELEATGYSPPTPVHMECERAVALLAGRLAGPAVDAAESRVL